MDVSGILRDSLVLSHALPCQMIATAVLANGIRRLQNRLSTEIRTCPAGSPYKGNVGGSSPSAPTI